MDESTWINPETNSVWIYSKTNLATNMAIAENLKKEDLTDEQIVPQNIMNTWTSSTRNKQANSQTNDLGITRLR